MILLHNYTIEEKFQTGDNYLLSSSLITQGNFIICVSLRHFYKKGRKRRVWQFFARRCELVETIIIIIIWFQGCQDDMLS